ncbi:MAG: iron ABC transporter permease [Myxococcales bacterium]
MVAPAHGRPLAPVLAGCLLATAAVAWLGLCVGAGALELEAPRLGWDSLGLADAAATVRQLAIREARLPRVLLGLIAGAAFATAGGVLQALTRNPLAAPSLAGVQPGAGLAVVLALWALPWISPGSLALVAFAGAFGGAGLVFALTAAAGPRAPSSTLLLAGVCVSMTAQAAILLVVLSTGFGQDVLVWQAGALTNASWSALKVMTPFWLAGFVLVAWLAPALRVLALGDEVSAGLGARPGVVRALGLLSVLLLAGATVAVTGPVGFVGLVVPHLARKLAGFDERRYLPVAAMLGACLIVLADALARSLRPPMELPVGVVTAALGAPLFLFWATRQTESGAAQEPR